MGGTGYTASPCRDEGRAESAGSVGEAAVSGSGSGKDFATSGVSSKALGDIPIKPIDLGRVKINCHNGYPLYSQQRW